MGEVVSIFERAIAALQEPLSPDQAHIDAGDGSGDDGGMDSRMTALETRMDVVLPTLATKADLSAMESKLVRWTVGIGVAGVTVMISILGFLASRVEVRAPVPSATPPIIINIPGSLQGGASASGAADGRLQVQPPGK